MLSPITPVVVLALTATSGDLPLLSGTVQQATSLVWPSWPLSLTYCVPKGSHDKILMSEKSQVKLNSGRSVKRQINKTGFSCYYKIPINQYKTLL
jgi:hypothetical protein